MDCTPSGCLDLYQSALSGIGVSVMSCQVLLADTDATAVSHQTSKTKVYYSQYTRKRSNRTADFSNSNKSPTRCNNFPVYYPDVHLHLNIFRELSRPSSGAHDCSSSLGFYHCIVVMAVLCSWLGQL